ncbi:MAG: DUF1080 domain-containing protein [Chitinophagaceae bacterium]|nr:DUF1080 domain-containing protein [Chitinophagaceae bacterium]
MKTNYLFNVIVFSCCVIHTLHTQAQSAYQEIGLTDKTAFTDNTVNWKIAGDIWYNPYRNKLKEEAGTGILLNSSSGNSQAPLITKMEHGNMLLEFDFMLAPHASATVYLQGRYGIRLTDSWTNKNPIAQACGTILNENLKSDAGEIQHALNISPRSNVARAPGLWQHLLAVFQAPQFDANGNKKSNARLLQVALNGVLIHEDIILPYIASDAPFKSESKTGPLVFSTGNRMAFKNIRYTFFQDAEKEKVLMPVPVPVNGNTPLIVTPVNETILQRCFLGTKDHKMTVCAVIGEPGQIHYGINLEQGSIIRLWKGDFIDATTMWESRGEIQLSRPLGSVISLPSQPQVAQLANDQVPWPELTQKEYKFKGYFLDKQGRPVFNYTFNGLQISDQTVPSDDDRILTRTLQFGNNPAGNNLWIRLATGDKIEQLENGLYAVNNKSYYLRLDGKKQRGAILRNINGREELIMPASALSGRGLTWSYIW